MTDTFEGDLATWWDEAERQAAESYDLLHDWYVKWVDVPGGPVADTIRLLDELRSHLAAMPTQPDVNEGLLAVPEGAIHPRRGPCVCGAVNVCQQHCAYCLKGDEPCEDHVRL